ncbi:uncharacterized protein LOC130010639 [Patella vulgata]|uniref:uncharacterized protein LOC130010639 n=1 Tax=Patella vulgata TaxID=6465 RepID=UPI0024A8D32C|nr:uncharacterized protein LOC130010639 [Patella vulgata]
MEDDANDLDFAPPSETEMGCTFTWSSQPTLNKMGAENLLLSAAVLFSGKTYGKVRDMADYLKLPVLGKSQFYALQKRYLFPVVNETWISCQIAVLDGLSREPRVVLSGDGRCDSPGHSAKYGTYSLMDDERGLISIVKKIVKACGKKKALAPLLDWLQSISNHFCENIKLHDT